MHQRDFPNGSDEMPPLPQFRDEEIIREMNWRERFYEEALQRFFKRLPPRNDSERNKSHSHTIKLVLAPFASSVAPGFGSFVISTSPPLHH